MCIRDRDGLTYVGTFPSAALETGEGDWTQLQRYPCNNMELRRAAYAYLYIKNPDGTPYEGMVNFRGGVYVNDEYKQGAMSVSYTHLHRCGSAGMVLFR